MFKKNIMRHNLKFTFRIRRLTFFFGPHFLFIMKGKSKLKIDSLNIEIFSVRIVLIVNSKLFISNRSNISNNTDKKVIVI